MEIAPEQMRRIVEGNRRSLGLPPQRGVAREAAMQRETYEVVIRGRFTLIDDEEYPADLPTAEYFARTFLGIGELDVDCGCPNYADLETVSVRVGPVLPGYERDEDGSS